MTRPHIVAVFLAAGLAVGSAAFADATPGVTKKDLDEVIGMLWADAQQWASDEDVDVASAVRVKEIWFTTGSVPLLTGAIRSIDPNTIGLYVINRLLRRLSYARTDTIRAALPAVKDLNGRVRKTYKPFPKLSDRQVEALKKPTSSSRVARDALARRRRVRTFVLWSGVLRRAKSGNELPHSKRAALELGRRGRKDR